MPKHTCERCGRKHETPPGSPRVKGLWCPPCLRHVQHSSKDNWGPPDRCPACIASGDYPSTKVDRKVP